VTAHWVGAALEAAPLRFTNLTRFYNKRKEKSIFKDLLFVKDTLFLILTLNS